MYCPNCSTEINEYSRFCHICGVEIANSSETSIENNSVCKCPKCKNELKQESLYCNMCGISTKENFQEKAYTFKEYGFSDKLREIISGKDIEFKTSEHMLIVCQELKVQNKITVIPYNEIESVQIKTKFNYGTIICILIMLCIDYWAINSFDGKLREILSFNVIIASFFIFLTFYKTILVTTTYGKRIVFNLKKKKKHLNELVYFENDLNRRLSLTQKIHDITIEQSNINIGYTNVRIKDLISEFAGKFE